MTYSTLKPLCVGTHAFAQHFRDACDALQAAHDAWVSTLRGQGVRAAHPDDGWVNREHNTVAFVFPYFNDGLAPGDMVALGTHAGHRIVRLVELLPSPWLTMQDRWRFTATPTKTEGTEP